MGLVDTLGFCISVFGLVIYLRFLLPHNIIPTISSMLTDAEQSLALAITIGAIPEMSDYKVGLAVLERQLRSSVLRVIILLDCFYRFGLLFDVPTGFIPWVVMDLFLLGTPQTVVTPPSSVTAGDTPADMTDPIPPVPVTVN
ncbi:hypothetical protein EDB83DRAFT_2519147 [Lactarius deliciosus]|nr:hypothetical protein EDB83DRAFT_2519147 [Lactarius deliciosus]